MSSANRSDDAFMFLTKEIPVSANERYIISFRIVFASQPGVECGGSGGAPGESVFLKAGASGKKPEVILVSDSSFGHYRVNVDIGNQSVGGDAASVVGTISNNSNNCSSDAPFLTVEKTHTHPIPVQSSADGRLWLIVGTDSGFEGTTTLYYKQIEATITPAP
jgi:hypothetical protein